MLKKDCNGFKRHAIKLTNAFQLVENGKSTRFDKDSTCLKKHDKDSNDELDNDGTTSKTKTKEHLEGVDLF